MTRKLSRIVISSVSEKSLSFATKQAMFGTLKRETFYPLPFGHRPIYTPQRFYIFMRRTTIPHSSFSRTLNPEP